MARTDSARSLPSLSLAFFVHRFPVTSQTFVVNQANGLLSRGHDVRIYALDGSSDRGDPAHDAVELRDLRSRTRYGSMVPTSAVERLRKLLPKLWRVGAGGSLRVCLRALDVLEHRRHAASLRLLWDALHVLPSRAQDILHCQFGTVGPRVLALRRIGALRGKLIVSFRGADISRAVHRNDGTIYRELFSRADFFLVNCEHFKRRLIAIGCEQRKLAVHRSGVDCQQFQAAAPRRPEHGRPVRIVTVGRLVEKKGMEYAIRAVARLAREHAVSYQIAGEGPLRAHLTGLIAGLGLEDTVTLLGARRPAAIAELLRDADLFVAPSVTARDGDEDAPLNTLKEAMAMGIPVIGTRHGGIPELVEDGVSGFLVAERDVDGLENRLRELIRQPELWPRMGRAGRARVETDYDLDELNDELVEIYRRVVGVTRTSPQLSAVS